MTRPPGQGLLGRGIGQREGEGGAHPQLAVHLDAATGILHHALDHVEADPRALDVVVETLEQAKELGQVLLGHPQAVVLHFQHRVARLGVGPHPDLGQTIRSAVLERVTQQVLQDLAQLLGRKPELGAGTDLHRELGPGGVQRRSPFPAHLLEQGRQVHHFGGLRVGPLEFGDVGELRERQPEAVQGLLHQG
nr:hypothetical protein [Hymenobacter qilianensis]